MKPIKPGATFEDGYGRVIIRYVVGNYVIYDRRPYPDGGLRTPGVIRNLELSRSEFTATFCEEASR